MQLDVSFLPAFGAAFILMFARLGTMIMLLPGLGERSVPVRVRLTVALVLTFVMFPLHRAGYTIDLRAPGPVIVALGQSIKRFVDREHSLRRIIRCDCDIFQRNTPKRRAMLPASQFGVHPPGFANKSSYRE